MEFHAAEIDQVLKKLKTSEEGLSDKEAIRRKEEHGSNELEEKEEVSILHIFFNQFKSVVILILIIAIIISALAAIFYTPEHWFDAAMITVIVILNAILGTVQEYRAEKAMEALKEMSAEKAVVLRGGVKKLIPSTDLVPGDIILLKAGDIVPTDARIIEAVNLHVEESSLTGESVPSQKETQKLGKDTPLGERENMVFTHTIVTYGRGKAVVTDIGMNTEIGKIAGFIHHTEEKKTPMQERLDEIGIKLGKVIIGLCALIFFLELWKANFAVPQETMLYFFMVAVSLAVSAIPEGLPAVATVTLAIGMQRMAKKNAVIRKLAAVETLGSTTVICSDKTGTLTKDEMTVKEIFVDGKSLQVAGSGYSKEGEITHDGKKVEINKTLELLLDTGVHCNDSEVKDKKVIGDPTEASLKVLGAKVELENRFERVDEIPFESKRKMMSTLHNTHHGYIQYTKGAPEAVLEKSKFIMEQGRKKKLTGKKREEILRENEKMASKALRVLAMAYKETESIGEEELIFLGLVGMIDPPRPEAKKAIETCEKAGMRVLMITGDNEITAKAIAEGIGLNAKHAYNGSEIERKTDEELRGIVKTATIFARMSPGHKHRIVKALQENGEVVAVTGDGVNDAPALKMADIGVAMGITGTDVSKEASDMVLKDDNFATIVSAVEEGRRIFENVRNFLKYMVSTNFDEIMVVGGGALIGLTNAATGKPFSPYAPIQILWLNIATDGLPALALGRDPADPKIMEKPPRPKRESVFHGTIKFTLMAGLLSTFATVFCFTYALGEQVLNPAAIPGEMIPRAVTMAFTASVLFELVLVFTCRPRKLSIFSNKTLLAAVAISFILQILIIYVPELNPFFKTAPLYAIDWVPLIGTAFLALIPSALRLDKDE